MSVVVPAFNNAAHIEQSMKSVLSQTYQDFELIVSDHGSADGTWEILSRFAGHPRVRITQISPGGGAERNWNHVTKMSSGELVKLLCADDLLAPDCLARQVSAFEAAGDGVVMVACRRDIIDARGRVIAKGRGLSGLSGRVNGAVASRAAVRAGTNVFGEPACVMFRRRSLVAAGIWDGSDGYVIDLATYLNVLAHGDLVALPESLAAFRVSSGQWSMRLLRDQRRQVVELLRRVDRAQPGRFSRFDLALGSVMTRVQTNRRRLVYRLLAHRL